MVNCGTSGLLGGRRVEGLPAKSFIVPSSPFIFVETFEVEAFFFGAGVVFFEAVAFAVVFFAVAFFATEPVVRGFFVPVVFFGLAIILLLCFRLWRLRFSWFIF